ncbi:MAG: tellurite resistance/C4-dicarboxylate transporter family protein, partial [Ignavibacteria bacterium]|nr:tellurite resistance/C4-dicarboxylate transporter family protein [Ignavibacteria bacterium]
MISNNTYSSTSSHFTLRVRELVKNLPPAYFAMVMSTGIISISCYLLEMDLLAHILFWLNLWFYISLWVLSLLRIFFHHKDFFKDMIDHQKGPGFFTVVAGSCILGSQFIIIFENYSASFILWIIGLILWVILNYTIFTGFTVKENKPSLEEGITGAWLLAVVATQSIAVLSTLIAVQLEQP